MQPSLSLPSCTRGANCKVSRRTLCIFPITPAFLCRQHEVALGVGMRSGASDRQASVGFCQPIPLFTGPQAPSAIYLVELVSAQVVTVAVNHEAFMLHSLVSAENSWLYRPMCRAGCGRTLGCISLFACAFPALPVSIEFLSILDLKLVVVPAKESGVRGIEREKVRFNALRGKGNGGDRHIGETVEWGERI